MLLLEAGGDPCADNDLGRYLYEVPIFNGLSTEYKECAWDLLWLSATIPDSNSRSGIASMWPANDGVWYPRAGTLGGCTAHNAMITVIPQDSDWTISRRSPVMMMARGKHAPVLDAPGKLQIRSDPIRSKA